MGCAASRDAIDELRDRALPSRKGNLIVDDADDGPWIKILQYGEDPYKPTAAAAGELTCGFMQNTFAKLSDHRINQLAGDDYYLRFMSQNTTTFLYAHIRGLRFVDKECVMGYGNKADYGLKVSRGFAQGSFRYGRHGCANGDKLTLDTECGVTGNNKHRWFADDCGKISADYPNKKYGVRAFNQGMTAGHGRRVQVSVWLRSSTATEICDRADPEACAEVVVMGQSISKAMPPLIEAVEVFKKDLGVHGSLREVVDATCEQLGVSTKGLNLMEKATQCWQKLN